jgi:hypothetical protein
MGTLSYRRGTKSFAGTVRGDVVTFRCPCTVYPGAQIAVEMSLAQAEALLARKPAREVLSGFTRETIELFSSGLTPAEFDLLYCREAKPVREYDLYADPGSGVAAVPMVDPSASLF